MSAIGGVVFLDGSRPESPLLKRMANILEPYGPDSKSFIVSNNMGFLRTLLRTSPEDTYDEQPIHDKSTKSLFCWDGRLDNREELIFALNGTSSQYARTADSRVAFEYLLRFGKTGIKDILGDFTFAYWSGVTKKLLLARDALGVRPIYWFMDQARFAWSTMPKGLFAIPGIEKELDKEMVEDLLCLIPVERGKSLYQNIRSLQPGHFLELGGNSVSIERFFEFSAKEVRSFDRDEDYVEALKEHIQRAVNCRLRSFTRVGSELSSGLDSSTITAFAAAELEKGGIELNCYTSVPAEGFRDQVMDGFYADEGPGATAVASRLKNVRHKLLRTDKTIAFDVLSEFIEAADRPPLNVTNLPWSWGIKKEAVSDGCRVLLNGGLGNYSISYDGYHLLPRLLWGGRLLSWFRESRAVRQRHGGVGWRWLIYNSVGAGIPGWLWNWMQGRKNRNWTLSDYSAVSLSSNRLVALKRRALARGLDLHYRPPKGGKRQLLMSLGRFDLGDYYAAYNTLGIEVRSPALDRRLVQYCLSVPERLFLRNGVSKWLLKEVVRGVLPTEILDQKRTGLQAADWYQSYSSRISDVKSAIESISGNKNVQDAVDCDEMLRLVDDWPSSGWAERSVHQRYRLKLLRGMGVGTFIKYVDGKNE